MNWLRTKVSKLISESTPPVNHDNNFYHEGTTSGSDFQDLSANDALTQILKAGAQKMLKAAIEHEASNYVDERSDIVDEYGRRQVVRNGTLPEREILTGLGPVTVSQPRVRDKRPTDQLLN